MCSLKNLGGSKKLKILIKPIIYNISVLCLSHKTLETVS
jgi:hypothetical protein